MKPTIIDADSGRELWTASECADHAGTSRGTFTSYAGRGRAPEPAAKHHGLTLWDSQEVKDWNAGRQRRAQEGQAQESQDPEGPTSS
ncbi:MAG: hypothetical protein ACTH2Y_04845 [Corynebacterium sp.]|uniref:hypothetical protein n=1 Tax=unclassified Corynebacterium TaxID=2624378 RepID=UPI002649920E|nr:hypothetical protein [Corynebacterium sp.]MDN5721195.1 hypothetical protein [Corynebacterium sp.]MDN6258708.1 hypothetical protein [Corynebacterium sp.]MDN6325733.1 hypothetical protein [Corynebacterium sp.]MDN6511039.1 hypothetical protein [Corynebacterium sp.]